MSLIIKRFRPEHLYGLEFRQVDRESMKGIPNTAGMIENMARNGLFYTVFDDYSRIVAVAGVYELWPGVGEAWFGPTDLIEKHALSVTRAVKYFLTVITIALRLHRVQADVIEYHARSHAWLTKTLGFSEEGLMKSYGPLGENYVRYARVA